MPLHISVSKSVSVIIRSRDNFSMLISTDNFQDVDMDTDTESDTDTGKDMDNFNIHYTKKPNSVENVRILAIKQAFIH